MNILNSTLTIQLKAFNQYALNLKGLMFNMFQKIKVNKNDLNIDLGYGTFDIAKFIVLTTIFAIVGVLILVDYSYFGSLNDVFKLVSLILTLFLILVFVITGIIKIIGVKMEKDTFTYFVYPLWFMKFTGLTELLGSILLLGGFFNNIFFIIGGFYASAIMVGALFTHILRTNDNKWLAALVLFSLGGYVFLINLLLFI